MQQLQRSRCAAPAPRCLAAAPPMSRMLLPLPLRAHAFSAQPAARRRTLWIAAAQKQQQESKESSKWQAPAWPGRGQQRDSSSSSDTSSSDDGEGERWALLDPKAYNQPWTVPWGAGAVAGTMAAWVATFLFTAFLAAPASYTLTHGGKPLWELGPAGQADFALWSEVMELVVTGGLLWLVASRHPEEVKEERLFNFSPSRPFARGSGWLAWGLMGTLAAPALVGAAAAVLSATGYENAVAGGRGTVDGVAAMLTLDVPTYLRLVGVTGVLAPLLEESLFRGFLLTSLTKFMPVPAAIFASSLAFGIAHLSLRDLPVLVVLGCLLGTLYVRSRNLLTPMMVHGVWNSSVLTILFALTAAGVDVQQLLKEGGL